MIPLFKFKIKGHSMAPTIQDDQGVLVSNISYLFSKPKIGDIIAFKFEDKIFIKRIARINQGKFFVKGDNDMDSLDSEKIGWINRKDILGEVLHY